ncbi:MAG: hypothetical protein JOZ19_09785 [Rubrobacter sp.]|nr:hypothetical protein [Rubrobacter sp.]
MRIIVVLLQTLAVVVLVLGALLLLVDPRLRDLAVEDLSLLVPGTKSSSDEGKKSTPTKETPQQDKAEQGPPTITPSGYSIASGCALWTAEGLNLYYNPVDPTSICALPPGSSIQPGTQASGAVQLPPNCAISPDSVTYCVVDGQLSADTLQAFYNRGELQAPHESPG